MLCVCILRPFMAGYDVCGFLGDRWTENVYDMELYVAIKGERQFTLGVGVS